MSVAAPANPSSPARRIAPALKVTVTALGGIALGLFIAAGVLLIVVTQFLDYHLVAIQSDSMEPSYSKGDLVFTRPAAMADIDQGDVVLFNETNTGIPFVHRVVAIQEYRQDLRDGNTGELMETHSEFVLRTRGDANENADSNSVNSDNYRGLVIASVPTGAWFGSDVSIGMILTFVAVGLAACWIAWEAISRIVRGRRRRNPEAAA